MRQYEVPVVAMPLLPEDIKTKLVPALVKVAQKNGGTLTVKDEWGKRHLAYPIHLNNGGNLEEGYYIIFNLEIDAAAIDKFQRDLQRIKDVVRFLVIRDDQL